MLQPGDAIDEQALAARYRVSRTPVREALLQLKGQGMLDSQARSGMVVARMDMQELLAIWELMAEMEGVCTRMACLRMSTPERQELARAHRAAAPIAQGDDAQAWRDANHAFPQMPYRRSRNPCLPRQQTGRASEREQVGQ